MGRRRRSKRGKISASKRRRNFPVIAESVEKLPPNPNEMHKKLFKPLSVRVVSIDPGMNMGICVSNLDFTQQKQEVLFVDTFYIDKKKKGFEDKPYGLASNALINTQTIRKLIGDVLQEYQPDVVICEAAFLGKFPQACASLCLCLNAIETAVFDYDYDVGFYTFDPPTVKNAMGVYGRSKDKDDMQKALMKNERIISEKDLSVLDEHSVDSICVGHCYFKLTAEF